MGDFSQSALSVCVVDPCVCDRLGDFSLSTLANLRSDFNFVRNFGGFAGNFWWKEVFFASLQQFRCRSLVLADVVAPDVVGSLAYRFQAPLAHEFAVLIEIGILR